MPPRPYRAKLRMAQKRFEAVLMRTLKPGRRMTYDFESKEAAVRSALAHLKTFSDGEAEVWERETDGAAPTRKVWPEEPVKRKSRTKTQAARR